MTSVIHIDFKGFRWQREQAAELRAKATYLRLAAEQRARFLERSADVLDGGTDDGRPCDTEEPA